MRERTRAIACLLLCCLVTSSATSAQNDPRVRAAVDPRIELLATVQALSDYGWSGLITRHEFTYKTELLGHFEPLREHRAVAMFSEMSRKGFSFDAPIAMILHLGPPPMLEPIAAFDESLVARAGSAEQLDAFIEALREFARESAFMNFFDAHRDTYDAIERGVREHLTGIDAATLEAYYGTRQHSYNIIPAPLLHPGGFGPRIRREDGRFDIFSVCGPRAVKDDLPVFGAAEDFRYLIWHEFGHSFVNPVVDQYGKEVDRYEALFEPIAEQMRKQAYPKWRTCVYEHVVRAVTCRLAACEMGEEEGRRAIEHEEFRGFRYVKALGERLEEYETQREKYPTFESFFPRLVEVFAEAAVAPIDPKAEEAAPPRIIRTVPENGAIDVDPDLIELRVEFSQDMNPGGYAWVQRSSETFPETTGKPHWISPRICALPVRLVPGRSYWIGLNVGRFRSFSSVDGVTAEAWTLEFTTAPAPAGGADP